MTEGERMEGSNRPLFWRAILPRAGGLRRSRWALALPILATAACVSMPPRAPLLASQPVFSPQAFFNGHTAGEGVLKVMLSRPRRVQVDGEGEVTADGALTLRQQVSEEGKPSRSRLWHLQPGRDGLFTGTLSDARGPVYADVRGNQLHIRFVTPDHLQVEQWIYLQPGGMTALNRMVVRRFGVRVAGLQETIRRTP